MDGFTYDDLKVLPIEDPALADVPLLKILYTDEFKLLIGRLNALICLNELSERALQVTQEVIGKVPSNYTAWQFRFRIMREISKEQDLLDELEWCNSTAKKNEKNYQIWHYRELIIAHLIESILSGDKSKYDLTSEHEIVELMLDNDEKNYHVWTHKRWMVKYFGLMGDTRELEYTKKLISNDVRNNSAWSHRMFILGDTPFEEELEFVASEISKSPTNPSTWNYIRGLCAKYGETLSAIHSVCEKYAESESAPALGVWVDVLLQEKNYEKAKTVLQTLSTKVDTLRANYWQYKLESVNTSQIGNS